MLFIFLNWIYIFFIVMGVGIMLNSILHIRISLFYTLLTGMFAEMLLIHIYAIWFPINEIFYFLNFLLALIGVIYHKNLTQMQLSSTFSEWKSWRKSIKILGILLSILILMQTATRPFIVDNETYYIQSIKWLNEFGLVKGLANLHYFFGQMSGWHLLQSGFNFGFLSSSLNNLNGFLMLIFTCFSLHHLNRFFEMKLTMDLFLGLIPVGNLFLFQFINVPSPDLPVFLISQIIFYLFYRNYVNYQGDFRVLFLLCLLLFLSKITVAPLLILPLVLMIRHKLFKKEAGISMLFAALTLTVFFLKNYLISGYLFYPTEFLSAWLNPDWKVAPELQQFFFREINAQLKSTFGAIQQTQNTKLENFIHWIFEPGMRSIFNKLIILLLLIFPFYIYKNKTLFWLYIYAILQFGILYFTAPQYRFFMPLIIGMGLYILAKLLLKFPKKVIPFITFFSLIALIPLLFSLNVSNIKNSAFMPDKLQAFQTENIIVPPGNSLHHFEYETVKEGNLIYQSPLGEKVFFWITSDGNLPCVNATMIEYFKNSYGIRPQLRTENLKDGFYSEKIIPER